MSTFQAKDSFFAAAKSYYSDERFSDFTIKCEDREFKVHRCFIAPHSKFFEKSCDGMFQETQQRKIDLKEDDPNMVEIIVRFFYNFDYDNTPVQSELTPLALHVRVYCIADKYEVLTLKSIALSKFKNALAASYKDGKAMVDATYALNDYVALPTCDMTLHHLLVEAWILGGQEMFATIDTTEVASLFADAPWLSAALASRLLQGTKQDSLRGHCNKGCSQLTRSDPGSLMAGISVKCSRCGVGDCAKEGRMTIMSHVELKRVWCEPVKQE